ncbi:MAG: glycosyltransferase [Cyanobacteria bacterium P01_C01_bin.70]
MSLPTISIVIPAYNAENTIAETISSVLAQTFTDFELIIINDGSIDNTLSIVEQFSDSRIQVFTFENSGPQKSRNRGLEKSDGKFISFIDADDLWTEDKLELQLKTLQKNPEASVVYSWCDVIDEQSNFLRRGGYLIRRGEVFTDLLLINFGENGSNFLASSEAIKAVGGFDETIVASQDRDILLSLASRYKFEVVPKVQVLYRKSAASKSWSSSIKRTRVGIEQVINKHTRNKLDLSLYRRQGLSNSYKHMIFECLNNHPSRKKGLYALNLLFLTIINDQNFAFKGAFLKILNRILIAIALPEKASSQIMKYFPKLFDITSIYGYLKIDKDLIFQR